MLSSSYITQISVRSEIGAPYFGTAWMKSPNGRSVA